MTSGRLVNCGAAARNGHPAFPLNAARPLEEIELSEFWRVVESNLPLILAVFSLLTVIGVLLTAWFTWKQDRYNRPEVLVGQYFPNKERPHKIAYRVRTESSKWLIKGIRIRRRWHSHLAKAEGAKTDDYGLFTSGKPGPWCRHVRFDPPVRIGFVLIHSDAPKAFFLRIDLCMSSDPKTKSRVVRRMGVGD